MALSLCILVYNNAFNLSMVRFVSETLVDERNGVIAFGSIFLVSSIVEIFKRGHQVYFEAENYICATGVV